MLNKYIIMFSIGYRGRKIDDFINVLQRYGIRMLVDVRSKPYSRYQPNYNKNRLSKTLSRYQIQYVHKIKLGGLPENPELYTDGIADYNKMELLEEYRLEIDGLIEMSKSHVLCLMCSEQNPEACHRKHLVGNTLFKLAVTVLHIDEHYNVSPHITVS